MTTMNAFARVAHGVYRFSASPARGSSLQAATSTRAPLAVADAPAKGPHVTIVGGVHGNERIGVLVLDALRQALLLPSPSALTVAEGATVTLVYGNERAIRTGKRGSVPHADLNRCFTTQILQSQAQPSPSKKNTKKEELKLYEHERARELAPIFAQSDLLIDLHSTNKPSPPFVRVAGFSHRSLPQRVHALVARLPSDALLLDPSFALADGSVALTDEYVGACGGIGICYESGLASDLSDAKVTRILRSVTDILVEDTRCVHAGQKTTTLTSKRGSEAGFGDVFEITEVFKLTERGFRWASGVGDTNFQRIPARTTIGVIAPDTVDEHAFAVNYDAHIVFPKVPELWKVGAPLGWLTKKVSR